MSLWSQMTIRTIIHFNKQVPWLRDAQISQLSILENSRNKNIVYPRYNLPKRLTLTERDYQITLKELKTSLKLKRIFCMRVKTKERGRNHLLILLLYLLLTLHNILRRIVVSSKVGNLRAPSKHQSLSNQVQLLPLLYQRKWLILISNSL